MTDLGEDALPEPKASSASTSPSDDSTVTTVEKQDAPPNEPAAPEASVPRTDEGSERQVTTVKREPMKIPSTVHVRITPDVLKDYVGPPVYHKDRLYTKAPPPGVSTGLGYLGNGSGAVMPIEATVRFAPRISEVTRSLIRGSLSRACRAKADFN